jgi:hypothetical protein
VLYRAGPIRLFAYLGSGKALIGNLKFYCPVTRLTNGFSKKAENHAAMVAIHFMYYNFARIHKTLRVTSAMAAGLVDQVWSLEEIVLLAN